MQDQTSDSVVCLYLPDIQDVLITEQVHVLIVRGYRPPHGPHHTCG
jgi:hypothetical protein